MREKRGGAWDTPPATIRSASRGGYFAGNGSPDEGFRVARSF
jgi:hypothetical protein